MLAPLAGRIYDHAPQQNAVPLGRETSDVRDLPLEAECIRALPQVTSHYGARMPPEVLIVYHLYSSGNPAPYDDYFITMDLRNVNVKELSKQHGEAKEYSRRKFPAVTNPVPVLAGVYRI